MTDKVPKAITQKALMQELQFLNKNEKFRSFKSKENIHKKEVGPYRGFKEPVIPRSDATTSDFGQLVEFW